MKRTGRRAGGPRAPFFVAAIILAASLAACASAPKPVTVSDLEHDREIALRVGQTLVVTLPTDRASGYGWALAQESLNTLMLDGEPSYMRESSPEAAPGASGSETWRLVALRKGRDTLRFDYRRPWQVGTPAARSARYTVIVR